MTEKQLISGFDTGERVPGGERTPTTPAESAAQAADDLAGVLRTHLCRPNVQARGGSLAILREYRQALANLEHALLNNAMNAKNEEVMRFLGGEVNTDPQAINLPTNPVRPYGRIEE